MESEDDASFCMLLNCPSSRPTHARGRVLTGDGATLFFHFWLRCGGLRDVQFCARSQRLATDPCDHFHGSSGNNSQSITHFFPWSSVVSVVVVSFFVLCCRRRFFLFFVLSLLLLLLCCCWLLLVAVAARAAAAGAVGGSCVFLSGCFSFRVDFSFFLRIFSVTQASAEKLSGVLCAARRARGLVITMMDDDEC